MHLLKQSTSITIQLGPFLDETDGHTPETGLTIAQADIRLSKNGANIAQTNDSGGATHDELGWYSLTLDATDTATLGRLLVIVHESGALPVWREFMVVTANVWDTLCSTAHFHVLDDAGDTLATEAKQDTIDGIVDNILVDTAVIGALGAGLTDLGGMSTSMKAEVQAEAEDALVAKHLDHLLAADYDPASKPGVATALLNEMVEDDSGVSRFTANALEEGPSGGGAATLANQTTIIDHLTDVKGTGFAKDTDSLVDLTHIATGSGAITFTYTVTSSVDSSPVADCTVWVTTDEAGTTIVASGITNASGEVVFYLDADTYYFWSQKAGWDFTNPDTEVVA